MRLVRQAQESKTVVQTLADRGAAFLTVVAIAVAIIALTYWLNYNVKFAVERIVPLVAVVTSLRGARKGILIRNRRTFEQSN